MTRQWLAPPELMCSQHLLGEHAETHMFLTKMIKHHSLEGFRKGSMFFGAGFVFSRHEALTQYIPGHQTPLAIPPELFERYPYIEPTREDTKKSLSDLLSRCPKCYQKMMNRLERESDAKAV